MPGLDTILSSQATTLGLAAMIVVALMTGVITPGKAAQKRVDDANQRAEDYRTLYTAKEAEAQAMRAQLLAIANGESQLTNALDLRQARTDHKVPQE